MQKILLLGLMMIILSSCGFIDSKKIINTNSGANTSKNITTKVLSNAEKKEKIEINKKEKIANLRKKLALKGLIIKGNINLQNKEYTSALIKYLQIYKKIPTDEATIAKLGDIYFSLKKFKKAYSYYSKIKGSNKLDNNKAATTLIYSLSIKKENILKMNIELDSLGLSKDELFYYKNSLSCKKDFSQCKQNFQDYFAERKKENEKKTKKEKTGTGIIEKETIKQFEELYNIEKALKNYEDFQIDDLSYKGALVSGAYYQNKLYPIAIETSKSLLQKKKDYKPLLKIIAKSYFELGDFINAKIYLIKYNRVNKKDDPEASYFLGVIYENLREYILSTIHFKKALKTGYKNTLEINKRLLFNYYELGEIDRMLEIFKVIITENKKDITSEDYNLAIYYNIINDKLSDAKQYTKEALELYPESEIFNGYFGWILIKEINSKSKNQQSENTINENSDSPNQEDLYKEAEKYINIGLELNFKNPMITLVKGKLEMSKGNAKKAFIYFKKTILLDNKGDFGKIAKQELENIQINK